MQNQVKEENYHHPDTGEMLDKTKSTISGMFNQIAPSYDLLNHLLSLNIDKYWRNKLVCYLKKYSGKLQKNEQKGAFKELKVLDIACGTGDSTIAIYKKGMAVTGVDIAEKMMEIAKEKNKRIKQQYTKNGTPLPLPEYITASAESLPFEESTFDAVSIAFGIRNFNRRSDCLKDIYRVLRPGGSIAILEFAKPRNKALKGIYNLYFNNILPLVGRLISKEKKAYGYLARSVEQFPKFEAFSAELSSAGFSSVSYKSYTFGLAVLYTGEKPFSRIENTNNDVAR